MMNTSSGPARARIVQTLEDDVRTNMFDTWWRHISLVFDKGGSGKDDKSPDEMYALRVAARGMADDLAVKRANRMTVDQTKMDQAIRELALRRVRL